MTRAESFLKRGKCSKNHCSAISNSAWTDLNSQGNILKLHDKCPDPKCGCQKIITFTPHQCMLQGGSIKSKLQKIFRGSKKAWDNFIIPGLKMATPLISAAVAAKTKKLQSAQVTSNILKSLTGGKILSLTDMHGNGLHLKVMRNHFKYCILSK